ncbi:MAG: FapA family protein [Candidatus Zixiibacteriota bacterium]
MSNDIKYLKTRAGVNLSVHAEGTVVQLKIDADKVEGEALTPQDITSILAENGITYGIDESAIATALCGPGESNPIVIAQGYPAQDGADAQVELTFEIRTVKEPTVDERGRIDYKNLSFIQNAREGQTLARKIAATPGVAGKSVYGVEIAPKPGRDRQLGAGTNAKISEDGLELLATIDGTIAYKFGIVGVHPNENIPDSVDTRTGNIDCVGSIKIGKNVSSDFKVVAGHNIEVSGAVEDATIQAGGSVLIHGGFCGGGKGRIIAGGDVTAKYVENQKIRSGGSVYIGGEALGSDIYAEDSVVIKGKPGSIIGGTIAAKYLVRAPIIGNDASVPTHIHVAYDMKTVDRLREIGKELERLVSDEKRIKEAMVLLYKLDMDGKLPVDKKQALAQFRAFIDDMPNLVEELKREQEELRSRLQELTGARIIAEVKAHAGTVLHFGVIYKELLEDEKGPIVFERFGDTIIKSPFDSTHERALEEEKKRRHLEVAAELTAAESRPTERAAAV